MNRNRKVISIGLDGATWEVIKPLVDQGELPTFKQLMEHGAWGMLNSTTPPLSPSAWVSIYTGFKPSNHGIFAFVKRKEDSYFYRPISFRDIKKPPLWEILSPYDKTSIVVNALFMYPPKRINGILITGLGTPSLNSNFTYPPEEKEFILKNFPRYDVDFDEDLLLVSDNISKFVAKIEEVTIEQMRLTKDYLTHKEWDFMFSIFRALDVIQHYFWNDPQTITKFYKMFDQFLGELIEYLSENLDDYALFLMSDHGFGPVKKYFCVHNWLEETGLLKHAKARERLPITAESIKKIMLKLGLRDIVWKLKRSRLIEKALTIVPSEVSYIHQIKWDETTAYYYEGSAGIININLMGREPNGTVPEKEYQKIVNRIIAMLQDVKDPETGEYIVQAVYNKKELFNTDDKSLPDIYFVLKEGYSAIGYNRKGNSIFMDPSEEKIPRCGDHRPEGIFVAYGPNVKPQRITTTLYLWDITPTILALFGIPLQEYNLDGRVIREIFHNQALLKESPKSTALQVSLHNTIKKLLKEGKL